MTQVMWKHMWFDPFIKNKQPILALAPMADMTDSAFSVIVKEIGGCDVIFREMVSAEAIVRNNQKTWRMVALTDQERPVIQQIFGADPKAMAQAAAAIVETEHPEGIDINMGCPANKIISNFNGCALMKDPETAAAVVREVKAAIGSVPVSVKIRLGWKDPDEFKTFIPLLEKAGVDLISVHGRTKEQGYGGTADWARIGEAKRVASVPVLANGDIHRPEQVREALEVTKADGVLIARGALGNPWFFKEARELGFHPTWAERSRVIVEHAKRHEHIYGSRGMVTFRKHLAWYLKSSRLDEQLVGIKEFRIQLMKITTVEEIRVILDEMGMRLTK